MLTLDVAPARAADTCLRRRLPPLPDPPLLPWSELSVLGLDGETPWLYAPIERDPLATADGRTVVPRREIRRLHALRHVPFQRLVIAHELDPEGPVREFLP